MKVRVLKMTVPIEFITSDNWTSGGEIWNFVFSFVWLIVLVGSKQLFWIIFVYSSTMIIMYSEDIHVPIFLLTSFTFNELLLSKWFQMYHFLLIKMNWWFIFFKRMSISIWKMNSINFILLLDSVHIWKKQIVTISY